MAENVTIKINVTNAMKKLEKIIRSQTYIFETGKHFRIEQEEVNMSTDLKDPWESLKKYAVPTTGTFSVFPEPKIKKEIIGKAVADCKAGKLCLIESAVWVDEKTKKPKTELRIIYKDVKENELLYDCETKEINHLCSIFMQVIKEFKLKPKELADMLEQKKNTETIMNS